MQLFKYPLNRKTYQLPEFFFLLKTPFVAVDLKSSILERVAGVLRLIVPGVKVNLSIAGRRLQPNR